MNCEELSIHVVDYLDGTLSADISAGLEAHVEGCDACREQLSVLRQTWTGLGELPQEEPSPRLRERFYAMLDAEQRATSAVPRPASGVGAWFEGFGIRRLVPQAIAAGLVFVGGILIGAQM